MTGNELDNSALEGGLHRNLPDVNDRRLPIRIGDGVLCKSIRLSVEARELLDDIGADVAIFLLYLLRCLQAALWLSSIPEQRLDKICDVATGNWNRLDRRANDVSFSDWNDMGYTFPRVDYGASQGAVLHFR